MYVAGDTGGMFMDLVYMTEDTGEIGEAKERRRWSFIISGLPEVPMASSRSRWLV
jgi:hypothetical protein